MGKIIIKKPYLRELSCQARAKDIYGCKSMHTGKESYCLNCEVKLHQVGCSLFNSVADALIKRCPECFKVSKKVVLYE